VFVVKDDNTVAMRPVTVSKQDEMQAVIASGLEPPERVVTTGFVNLTDGSKIRVSNPDRQPPGAGAPAERQRRGPPGQRRTNGGAPGSGGGASR
jgi:multidrug efflux system membrane fusion protein